MRKNIRRSLVVAVTAAGLCAVGAASASATPLPVTPDTGAVTGVTEQATTNVRDLTSAVPPKSPVKKTPVEGLAGDVTSKAGGLSDGVGPVQDVRRQARKLTGGSQPAQAVETAKQTAGQATERVRETAGTAPAVTPQLPTEPSVDAPVGSGVPATPAAPVVSKVTGALSQAPEAPVAPAAPNTPDLPADVAGGKVNPERLTKAPHRARQLGQPAVARVVGTAKSTVAGVRGVKATDGVAPKVSAPSAPAGLELPVDPQAPAAPQAPVTPAAAPGALAKPALAGTSVAPGRSVAPTVLFTVRKAAADLKNPAHAPIMRTQPVQPTTLPADAR